MRVCCWLLLLLAALSLLPQGNLPLAYAVKDDEAAMSPGRFSLLLNASESLIAAQYPRGAIFTGSQGDFALNVAIEPYQVNQEWLGKIEARLTLIADETSMIAFQILQLLADGEISASEIPEIQKYASYLRQLSDLILLESDGYNPGSLSRLGQVAEDLQAIGEEKSILRLREGPDILNEANMLGGQALLLLKMRAIPAASMLKGLADQLLLFKVVIEAVASDYVIDPGEITDLRAIALAIYDPTTTTGIASLLAELAKSFERRGAIPAEASTPLAALITALKKDAAILRKVSAKIHAILQTEMGPLLSDHELPLAGILMLREVADSILNVTAELGGKAWVLHGLSSALLALSAPIWHWNTSKVSVAFAVESQLEKELQIQIAGKASLVTAVAYKLLEIAADDKITPDEQKTIDHLALEIWEMAGELGGISAQTSGIADKITDTLDMGGPNGILFLGLVAPDLLSEIAAHLGGESGVIAGAGLEVSEIIADFEAGLINEEAALLRLELVSDLLHEVADQIQRKSDSLQDVKDVLDQLAWSHPRESIFLKQLADRIQSFADLLGNESEAISDIESEIRSAISDSRIDQRDLKVLKLKESLLIARADAILDGAEKLSDTWFDHDGSMKIQEQVGTEDPLYLKLEAIGIMIEDFEFQLGGKALRVREAAQVLPDKFEVLREETLRISSLLRTDSASMIPAIIEIQAIASDGLLTIDEEATLKELASKLHALESEERALAWRIWSIADQFYENNWSSEALALREVACELVGKSGLVEIQAAAQLSYQEIGIQTGYGVTLQEVPLELRLDASILAWKSADLHTIAKVAAPAQEEVDEAEDVAEKIEEIQRNIVGLSKIVTEISAQLELLGEGVLAEQPLIIDHLESELESIGKGLYAKSKRLFLLVRDSHIEAKVMDQDLAKLSDELNDIAIRIEEISREVAAGNRIDSAVSLEVLEYRLLEVDKWLVFLWVLTSREDIGSEVLQLSGKAGIIERFEVFEGVELLSYHSEVSWDYDKDRDVAFQRRRDFAERILEQLAGATARIAELAAGLATRDLIDVYIPGDFGWLGSPYYAWTNSTNNYRFISVSRTSIADFVMPDGWRISISKTGMFGTVAVRLFNFTAPNVAGRYFVKVFTDGSSIGWEKFPTVTVIADMHPAYVSGTVYENSTLEPIEVAGKVLATGLTAEGRRVDAIAYFSADANGDFALWGLAPGTYDLTATASDHYPQTLTGVTVQAGQSLRGIKIFLHKNPEVRVRIWSRNATGPVDWGYREDTGSPRPIEIDITNQLGIPISVTRGQTTPDREYDEFTLATRTELTGKVPGDLADFVSGLEQATYLVRAFVPSYIQLQDYPLGIPEPGLIKETFLEISLRKTGWFRFTVHFLEKTHAEGELRLAVYERDGAIRAERSVTVAEGTEKIEGIDVIGMPGGFEPRIYWIQASMNGYVIDESKTTVPIYANVDLSDSPTDVSLTLMEGTTFAVSIRSVDSQMPPNPRPWRLPGKSVIVELIDFETGTQVAGATARQLPFTPVILKVFTTSLRAGTYVFRVRTFGYQEATSGILIGSEGTVANLQVDLQLSPILQLQIKYETELLRSAASNVTHVPIRVEAFNLEDGQLNGAAISYIDAGQSEVELMLAGFDSYYGRETSRDQELWSNFYDTTDGYRQPDMGFRPSHLLIRVWSPAYEQQGMLEAILTGGLDVALESKLLRLCRVSGTVFRENPYGDLIEASWGGVAAYENLGTVIGTSFIDGEYLMWVSSGDYTISVSLNGFAIKSVMVHAPLSGGVDLNFQLGEEVTRVSEISNMAPALLIAVIAITLIYSRKVRRCLDIA